MQASADDDEEEDRDADEGIPPLSPDAMASCGIPELDDPKSEAIPHPRADVHEGLDSFTLALGLWCEQSGISRVQYQSLLEVLHLVESVDTLRWLPKGLSALKKKCKSQFPIIAVRQTSIPVVSEQMPTLSAADRTTLRSLQNSDVFFQDPVSLIAVLVRSPVFRRSIHIGMAELVDRPTELWQSFSWGSSIRCTSGDFAKYPNGEPVFPSDFIQYTCNDVACMCKGLQTLHIGRVQFVARDRRSDALNPGAIRIRIKPVFAYSPHLNNTLFRHIRPAMDTLEVIILEDEERQLLISDTDVVSRLEVYLDYKYSGGVQEPPPETRGHFVRRVLVT